MQICDTYYAPQQSTRPTPLAISTVLCTVHTSSSRLSVDKKKLWKLGKTGFTNCMPIHHLHFIHSGYFYSASSSPLLLRCSRHSTDNVSEWRTFPRSLRGGCVASPCLSRCLYSNHCRCRNLSAEPFGPSSRTSCDHNCMSILFWLGACE